MKQKQIKQKTEQVEQVKLIHTCCQGVSPSDPWSRSMPTECGKRAKAERDGKWYCGIHDPVRVQERRKAEQEKQDEESYRQYKSRMKVDIAQECMKLLYRDHPDILQEVCKVVLSQASRTAWHRQSCERMLREIEEQGLGVLHIGDPALALDTEEYKQS